MANRLEARDFFGCNRFLFDAVSKGQATTLDQIARTLLMPRGALRQKLVEFGLPTRAASLFRLVRDIPVDSLPASPPVYRIYHERLRIDALFTHQDIELFLPFATTPPRLQRGT